MGIIGILAAAGYFFMRSFLHAENKPESTAPTKLEAAIDLRPSIIAKINDIINKGSNGLYSFSTKDMTVDVLAGSVLFLQPKLTPDFSKLPQLDKEKRAPDDVFTISLNSLKIKGLGLKDILSIKSIDLDTLEFIKPLITVYHKKRSYNNTAQDTATLYQKIMHNLEHLGVKKIIIKEGTLINENVAKGKKTKLDNLFVVLDNVVIDSTTQYSKDRFLFAKNAAIEIKNYRAKTANDLYQLSTDVVHISQNKNSVTITNLSLLPTLNKKAFARKVGHMQERYSIQVPSIQLKNLDWWALLNEEELKASEAVVSNAKFDVYLDRSQPSSGKSKVGMYPHQLLMKLPMKVNIRKLNLVNARVTYTEFNPLSEKSGTLYLDHLSAQATNLTNEKDQITKGRFAQVNAKAMVKESIPLTAHLTFDLAKYKQGKFTAQLSVGGTNDRKLVNDIAEPLGLLSIKTGTVTQLKSTINGTNTQGFGTVLLTYQNLHIQMLKKEEEGKGLAKRTLISKLANFLVIHDNNPQKGKKAVPEQASFTRDPEGTFFNLIWKTTLVGILKTIGAPAKLASKKSAPAS